MKRLVALVLMVLAVSLAVAEAQQRPSAASVFGAAPRQISQITR